MALTLRQRYEQRIIDKTSSFKEIAGAASLEQVLKGRIANKGCYIFRRRNSPRPNGWLGGASQLVYQSIGIAVVIRNVKIRGVDASDINESLCDEIQQTILGWEPTGEFGPTEYAGGSLVEMKNGFFVWLEIYRNTTHIKQLAD